MKCEICGKDTSINYGNANGVVCSACFGSDAATALTRTPLSKPQQGGVHKVGRCSRAPAIFGIIIDKWRRHRARITAVPAGLMNKAPQRSGQALGIDKNMTDYKTSIAVALFVSFIGWLAAVAGAVITVFLLNEGDQALRGVPSAITVALVGLLLVIGGQASRAVMENANYSRQILEYMRKNG